MFKGLKKKAKYDQNNENTDQICARIDEIERSLEDLRKQKPEPTHVIFAVFGHANGNHPKSCISC